MTGLFWLVGAVLNLANPTLHSHSINAFLTFSGATDQKYPNDSPFNATDVTVPVVLNRVYDQHDFTGHIDREDFVNAFTVTPYIPHLELIKQKYVASLAQKTLTQAEIDQLQDNLGNELNQASSQAVTITLSTTDALPREMIDKSLLEAPSVWADHMINNVGVTSLNQEIFSEKVLDTALIQNIDYLIGFEILREKIGLLKTNIDLTRTMPNGKLVRDDESALSAPDLARAIADLEAYLVLPLAAPIKANGVARDPGLVRSYFTQRLADLDRDRDLASRRKDNLKVAYMRHISNQLDPSQDDSTGAAIGRRGQRGS